MTNLVAREESRHGCSLEPVLRYGVKIRESVESGFASGCGRAAEAADRFQTIQHGEEFHAHGTQVAQLLLDLLEPTPAQFGDLSELGRAVAIAAKSGGGPVQPKKLLDLFEREAQLFATLNDAEIVEVGFRVLTITGGAARRRAQNPAPFIEADSLDVYTGAGGKLSDPHSLIVNLYLGTDSRFLSLRRFRRVPPGQFQQEAMCVMREGRSSHKHQGTSFYHADVVFFAVVNCFLG
jgi:hypothetical protein